MRMLPIFAQHAAAVQKSRVQVSNTRMVDNRTPDIKRQDDNTRVHINNSQPTAAEKAWWMRKTQKQQEAYMKAHPKSRKLRHLHNHSENFGKARLVNDNDHHSPSVTRETTKDVSAADDKGHVASLKKASEPKTSKIIYPEHKVKKPEPKTVEDMAKEEQLQKAWDITHKKSRQENAYGNNASLAFMMRHSRVKQKKAAYDDMDPDEAKTAKSEYKDWVQKYEKLSGNDLADVAENYYRENPKQANTDGVKSAGNTDFDTDESPEDELDDAKDAAENSPQAANVTVDKVFEKAYNSDPFKGMNPKQRLQYTGRAVNKIAQAFSADKNEIISNTYKFLNEAQIAQLKEAADDALQDNLQARSKRLMPEKRKKILKFMFIAAATAAGIAFGGLPIALLCLQHGLTLSGHKGNCHEVVWHALCGKDADGHDDPDFDAHDDAVEKIIRSLKKQLYNTDDEKEADGIQEVLDNLEQQQDNYHSTKYSGYSNSKKRKKKVESKLLKSLDMDTF